MDTIKRLLSQIEIHCRRHEMAESTFGRVAVNDGKLVARLRAGKSINLNTLAKIEGVLKRKPTEAAA